MMTSPLAATKRVIRTAFFAGAAGLLLASCGGTDDPAATDATVPSTSSTPGPSAAGPGGGPGGPGGVGAAMPGVRGLIAAVSGTTMQVQDSSSQSAVNWTDTTTFSVEKSGTQADVAVGSCVVAVTGSTDGQGASATSDSTATSAATTVRVSAAVDGACDAGLGGTGGFPGGFPGGGAPSGFPSGVPPSFSGTPPNGGSFPGAGDFGGFVVGLVTSVDGSTVTVTGDDGAESTFTVDDATAYTLTVTGDASSVVVGLCASAQGDADPSGAVAATSITISTPTDDSCVTRGLGGPGGLPTSGGTDG